MEEMIKVKGGSIWGPGYPMSYAERLAEEQKLRYNNWECSCGHTKTTDKVYEEVICQKCNKLMVKEEKCNSQSNLK